MKVLACLLMAWPLFVHAQPPMQGKPVSSEAAPVRTISEEAFQKWIKEDNQLIDGILLSLTHIDTLVTEIERMLKQLPDFGAAPAAAKPAPPPAPVVIEKTVIQEVPGPLGGWMPTLAGGALLALLAFWLGRKQAAAASSPQGKAAALPEPSPAPRIAEKAAVPAIEKRATPSAAPLAPPAAPLAESIVETKPALDFDSAPELSIPAEPERPLQATPSISIEQPSLGQGDQALELAEIMLSMGLGHGATQTLTEQIRNEPKQALRHWLKLLDIYRKNGQQEEFERSAEELRLHFNVRPEDWHAQSGATQSLESFPHIAKRLTELWGKPDCLVYMQNLLDDNRGGARSGFPQSVAEELLLLTAVMREAYGFILPG